MPIEVGQVVDGVVTGITDFGAFIQLPDGKTGLCHISEIADEYVKNVKDYLQEKQKVKVKIIEINPKGKISLSIRRASETPKKEDKTVMERKNAPRVHAQKSSPNLSFEEMLSKYLKDSDEKLKDFKKTVNRRRGNGYNRRES